MSCTSQRRLLLIEDSTNDTFLIIRELQRHGLEMEFERVETVDYLKAALGSKTWDLIICDCCLPQLDGLTALELVRQQGLDIPFIMVSGMMGEEHALKMIRAGAHDYVPKDNLARLGPAVLRELRVAEDRRGRANAGGAPATDRPQSPAKGLADLSAALLAGHGHIEANPDFKPAA